MARRQFLWIDPRGADCYFAAPGNIKCNSGDKGTLAIWQHAMVLGEPFQNAEIFFRVAVDANNYIQQYRGRTLQVCSGGSTKTVSVTNQIAMAGGGHGFVWELMVYTWNFTGGAGAGILNAYWDGAVGGTPVTNATAPVGTPTRLYLGPVVSSTFCQSPPCIGSVAVWDDVMTAPQAAELYAQGQRHRMVEGDGTGNMTLLATFDGALNADVAGGSPTFAALQAAERYCLVDDGLRYPGKRIFALGTPRHDLSEDDRVPLYVPLRPHVMYGRDAYQTAINNVNYSELRVTAGYASDRGVGLTFAGPPAYPFTELVPPCTFRQRIHVLNDANPKGKFIRIGPVDYYHAPLKVGSLYDQFSSGRSFSVVADGGNSATQFKTDLDAAFTEDYWNGADVTFLTGTCAGRRLKATDYIAATKTMVVGGALPATPTAGDVGVVDFRAVIQGCLSDSNTVQGERVTAMTMDAWLWDAYSTNCHFTELDWCYGAKWNTLNLGSINLLRYERGRTAYMDGVGYNKVGENALDKAFCYGRPATWQFDSAFYCDLLLERIEVEGPATYQILRRDASGHGPAYADNFMLTGQSGEGTKVWRKRNVTRATQRPTKNADPAAAKADLQSAGTWRHTVGSPPLPVERDTQTGVITALVAGTDAGGATRFGYCKGQWNEATGRISWVDESPPPGKSNPFITPMDMRPGQASDMLCTSGGWPLSVLPSPDGKQWYLVYCSQQVNDDHYLTYLLGPCVDRWSFSRAGHWWAGNPLMSILGGPDRLAPECNGAGQWINRDAEYYIVENPYTKDHSRRYWGWTRGKTINHKWRQNGGDCRPVAGMRGADLRSMMPLPHGNQLTPLVGMQVHQNASHVYRQSDCLMQYSDTATAASSGVYCYVSEDGVHWQTYADHTQWLPRQELPGESSRLYPGSPFRLGDRQVYYYSGGVVNFAWCRVDGECWYELDGGQTSGMLETSLIERPSEGWGPLVVNAAPGGGSVRVEVLDATETVIAGYGAANCGAVPDSVAHTVEWDGRGLEDVTADTIRLRFVFGYASGTRPRLYRWGIEDAVRTPEVAAHEPTGESVAVTAEVVVTFSATMDRQSTEAAFLLAPAPAGGFLWSNGGQTISFVPDGGLAEDTEYTVSVGDSAQSAEGTPLGAPFEWQFRTVARPSAANLRVEGTVDPTNVLDPTPEFSWEYTDPHALPQAACQVIVASTKQKLDANEGDVWDSGVVEASEESATYAGGSLRDNSVYYWKVRARNSEGVWSEEW